MYFRTSVWSGDSFPKPRTKILTSEMWKSSPRIDAVIAWKDCFLFFKNNNNQITILLQQAFEEQKQEQDESQLYTL